MVLVAVLEFLLHPGGGAGVHVDEAVGEDLRPLFGADLDDEFERDAAAVVSLDQSEEIDDVVPEEEGIDVDGVFLGEEEVGVLDEKDAVVEALALALEQAVMEGLAEELEEGLDVLLGHLGVGAVTTDVTEHVAARGDGLGGEQLREDGVEEGAGLAAKDEFGIGAGADLVNPGVELDGLLGFLPEGLVFVLGEEAGGEDPLEIGDLDLAAEALEREADDFARSGLDLVAEFRGDKGHARVDGVLGDALEEVAHAVEGEGLGLLQFEIDEDLAGLEIKFLHDAQSPGAVHEDLALGGAEEIRRGISGCPAAGSGVSPSRPGSEVIVEACAGASGVDGLEAAIRWGRGGKGHSCFSLDGEERIR